ncbi:MAG: hypothetical protein ACK552_15260 [Microcystis sp.]|jgi:hypothetical protein|nr:hypothetical protein [Microcystis aeruginosa LG13-12]
MPKNNEVQNPDGTYTEIPPGYVSSKRKVDAQGKYYPVPIDPIKEPPLPPTAKF